MCLVQSKFQSQSKEVCSHFFSWYLALPSWHFISTEYQVDFLIFGTYFYILDLPVNSLRVKYHLQCSFAVPLKCLAKCWAIYSHRKYSGLILLEVKICYFLRKIPFSESDINQHLKKDKCLQGRNNKSVEAISKFSPPFCRRSSPIVTKDHNS